MEKQEILDLIERIKVEPSVLFWGQNYLSTLDGRNVFYERVNEELCNNRLPQIVDYHALWDNINGGKEVTDINFQAMQEIIGEIPSQNWLRRILSMHWGMVMTSAIDTVMLHCVGNTFRINPIGYERKNFSRDMIAKSKLHGCFIYGNVDNNDKVLPRKFDNKTKILLKKQISERVSWIYNDILRDYGVLVIDGWNSETDWLGDLLENATQMPIGSIYLFGANSQIYQDDTIGVLMELGILQAESQTFGQALDAIGYFEEDNEDEWEQSSASDGKIVTITSKKETTYLNISYAETAKLDNHITLLYDDIWNGKEVDETRIKGQYAQFLSQTGTPIWPLYDPKFGFYFKRDVDEKLFNAVVSEMTKRGTYNRNAIILEGNSNTGKTTTLVNLAYRLRFKAPVLFISGNPEHNDYTEKIKNFIKDQILEKQSKGKWIENVVIIWDGNRDYQSTKRCFRLQQELLECNAIVVGSSYNIREQEKTDYKDHSGNYHIHISAVLSPKEKDRMLQSVEDIDKKMREQLECSLHNTLKNDDDAYLLHCFQKLAKLTYSPEWQGVAAALKTRFENEVDRTEEASEESLQKFRDDIADQVEREIVSRGAASHFQMQLQAYAEKNGIKMTSDLGNQPDSIKELFKLNKDIQILNRVLALAGEFSTELPLTLLLRIMSGDSSLLSKEKVFISKVIQSDSLLINYRDDQGYMMVSFRHPSEAEIYIKENLGDDVEIIKATEVELLCDIIKMCDWAEESKSVLRLVRRFGPNSFGKYSEEIIRQGHYNEYQKWWTEIAHCLKENSNNDAEAALVYAHLIRSEFEFSQNTEELLEAENFLQGIIDNHDRTWKSQYCRLLGEICANLAVSMRKDMPVDVATRFAQLKKYFSDAVKNWVDKDAQSLYTTNALLDTWLNGVLNYITINFGKDTSMVMNNQTCRDAVTDSLHYIDLLLDLTEDEFEQISILEKIDKIYKLSGKGNLAAIASTLKNENNDTYLFLKARNCWVTEESTEDKNNLISIVRNNLYMLPDDADRMELLREELPNLKQLAKKAAERAIALLEENQILIERSKSARCIYMLFRAKWLVYTGYLPFEEKQKPALSRAQWKEIAELCKKYIIYEGLDSQRIKPAPLMIRMVYLWVYADDKEGIYDLQNRLKNLLKNDWFFERIGLCKEGTKTLRCFHVDLSKRPNDSKHHAFVCDEINGQGNSNNLQRKAIHVPDPVLAVLIDGQKSDYIYRIDKNVTIWFNSKGPQLSLLGSESEA